MHKALEEMIIWKTINQAELKNLTEEERTELTKLVKEKLEDLNNHHTKLLQILGEIAELPANRLLWENNHLKITKAINDTLRKTGTMPNQNYIAEITGLSRQTIAKHLSAPELTSIYSEQLMNFNIMAPQVLNRVLLNATYRNASVPDIKLYFQLLEKMQDKNQSTIFNQHNYIQINNTIIKQETLQQLSPEQLKLIEEFVQKSLPVTDTLHAD